MGGRQTGVAQALLFATGLAAGCAQLPERLYSSDTPPAALLGVEQARLVDLRAEFRTAACRRLTADDPACDDLVLRLAGEAPATSPEPAADLARRFRVAFVPGLFAECFDRHARTFGDAQRSLEEEGFVAAYLPVAGRGSIVENADRLAEFLAILPEDPRPFVVFAHSKGLLDILEMVVRHPEASQNIAAIVGIAGAVNGSPLAGNLGALYRAGAAGFPFMDCKAGDGRELDDLERERRLTWWRDHRDDIEVPLYSLVAAPQPESISPLLRFSYDRLASIDPRNDGKLLWYDQIMPRSRLLGYVNADHWTIAVPAYKEIEALALLYDDRVPRGLLLRAAIEVVAASLAAPEEEVEGTD